MQITRMFHGARLLGIAGIPTAEVLGPDATDNEVKALIDRHKQLLAKPVFRGGVGKPGCWVPASGRSHWGPSLIGYMGNQNYVDFEG